MKNLIIIGNLTKDVKEIQKNDKNFGVFTVAVNGRKKEDETIFIDCMTSNTAVFPYLTKGTKVYVSGDFKLSVWSPEDKRDMPVPRLSIYVTTLELLGSKADSSNTAAAPQQAMPQQAMNNDLPF